MDAPRTKTDLLTLIRAARAEWDAVLAEVGEARMTTPGVTGEWSVKDLIAHNYWGEREMVRLLRDHALLPGPSDDLWAMSDDERNAVLYERDHDLPLAEVLAENKQVGTELLAVVETLTDADLTDPARFPGMPADWEPWRIIRGNSYGHYPEHIADIRAWLERT